MFKGVATGILFASLVPSLFAQRILQPSDLKITPFTHECFTHDLPRSCSINTVDEVNIYGCFDSQYGYYNYHSYVTAGPLDIHLQVTSSAFAPLIAVQRADGSLIADNFNASNTHVVELTAHLPEAGTYYFLVQPTQFLLTGPYALLLNCVQPQSATCTPTSTNLCLNNGRFKVSVNWKDFNGNQGVGTAVPMTSDTGYFWFFANTNVELVVKALDGRAFNNKWWIFYGALSNVEYTMIVTDTITNQQKVYHNASGNFGSVGDTGAF